MAEDNSTSLRSWPWPRIVDRYQSRRDGRKAETTALDGIEALAVMVAEGALSSALFGWVSMFDLCIQQMDVPPYSGPYLRIAPLASGAVEFRYIDTAIPQRQWHREVPPSAVIPRFQAFLDQLGWVA